jgi:ABC-2 type transport system permease protein
LAREVGASAGLWYAVVTTSARRHVSYRATTVAAVFANTILSGLRAYIVLALWRERPGLAGYDTTDAVTFAVVGQALVVFLAVFGGVIDIPWRVESGEIVSDIARPVGFLRWWLGHDVGRAWVFLLTRAAPPVAVTAVVFDVRLPSTPGAVSAFIVSTTLAFLVSFGIRYLVAMSVFWVADARGVMAVASVVSVFCSGAVLPLTIFPETVGTVARVLPFAATVQVPMDVYLGRETGLALAGALAFQAGWATALLTAGAVLTRRAIRRVVIQGG